MIHHYSVKANVQLIIICYNYTLIFSSLDDSVHTKMSKFLLNYTCNVVFNVIHNTKYGLSIGLISEMLVVYSVTN